MEMTSTIKIGDRTIGARQSTYVIAEMSANHNHEFDNAVKIVHAAKEAGADAVKLQTYTSDTMTVDCDSEIFRIGGGALWEGANLYQLYSDAYTPWEWQPRLKDIANGLGLACFSTPFDFTAVDFLEQMNVPAYKIASFELVDLPLIQRIARTGKPVIISTGMATLDEIAEAVDAFQLAGGTQLALLKCTSGYPASADEMHLRTIPDLAQRFHVPVGLSDHTLKIAVPVAAVALGACIIEKHLTLSRSTGGPDSQFSLEPEEFHEMVEAVRIAERARGEVHYGAAPKEGAMQTYRRSLFVVKDIGAGEPLTDENIRSIRPSSGLPPKFLPQVIGKKAKQFLKRGTPLQFDFIE